MMKFYVRPADEQISWIKCIPFLAVHLVPLAAIWTGVRWRDLALCAALYFVRMFFITAGYHRYFCHRSFRVGRVVQFIFAFGGGTAAQKGALWWAAHHRHHHKHSDERVDIHSPMKGVFWSHMGWIMCEKYEPTDLSVIRDLAKYPELRWLNRYHLAAPLSLGIACYLVGGWGALVTGFFLSTALLYHGTFCINSLMHIFGRRRYVTRDTSRNSLLLALISLGEGWHNNHHYYQRSTNQGFFWWEIDISYYLIVMMSWLGLARDLHRPPQQVLAGQRIADGFADIGMQMARGEA